jgi:tetratricopeptide (TPR) repeat protein
MKYLILITGILFWATDVNIAQVNRYNVASPAKDNSFNTFVGYDLESLYKLYQDASTVHEKNAKVIDTMIDNLYELKGKTDNSAFKNKLDEFLSQLKNLRMGSLLDADVKIKQIDWAIRDEIEKYNSGQYSTISNATKVTTSSYFSGDLVKIMHGGVLRDRPSVSANEIGDDKKWPVAKILQKIDEKYYSVEVDGRIAYISLAFLGEKLNKQQFDALNNIKDQNHSQNEYQTIYKAASDAYMSGDFTTARENIDKLLLKYNNPDLFYIRAETFYAEKNFEKAVLDLSKAIELNPNNARYYFFRGDVYYRMKDFISSLTDLSKGLKIYPYATDVYFLKGLMKSELGDKRGAISDYDSLIVHYVDTIPHNYNLATVYNNKAYCLIELEDFKAALPLATKALSLNNSLWYTWDTRGELYYKISKYQESISDMTKAISIEENANSFYYRGLAKIMIKLNGGCEDLSRAGELGKKEAYEAIKQNCK